MSRRYNDSKEVLTSLDYTPNKLLNFLLEKFAVKSDAQLACALNVPPRIISFIRIKRNVPSGEFLLRAMKYTGTTVPEIETLLGISF